MRFVTRNVNGIKQEKRQSLVLDFIVKKRIDILRLQESDTVKIRNIEIQGFHYIAVGVRPDTAYIVNERFKDIRGTLRFQEDGEVSSICWKGLVFVNVHLPSGTNKAIERQLVIQNTLPRYLRTGPLLLLGDFNCVLEEKDILSSSRKNIKRNISIELKEVVKTWKLVDV